MSRQEVDQGERACYFYSSANDMRADDDLSKPEVTFRTTSIPRGTLFSPTYARAGCVCLKRIEALYTKLTATIKRPNPQFLATVRSAVCSNTAHS